MNCKEAKTISIHEYLTRKGYAPLHTYHGEVQYIARHRDEQTGSLMVTADGTLYHDWGADQGGSIVDLAMAIMGTRDVSIALRDIEATMGASYRHNTITSISPVTSRVSRYEDVEAMPLTAPALIQYAASRGIPQDVLMQWCCEVHYRIHGYDHSWYAIGWPNRSGGYELRSAMRCGKGAIAPKDISILGDITGSTCLVFEGFFDYLSAVTMGWLDDGRTAIVLNSTALAKRAIPLLQTASEVHTWLDADDAGRRATLQIQEVIPGAQDYSGVLGVHADVNDFFLSPAKELIR